jgi:hypothetical protein
MSSMAYFFFNECMLYAYYENKTGGLFHCTNVLNEIIQKVVLVKKKKAKIVKILYVEF